MQLLKLDYPVYKLKSDPVVDDDIVYYYSEKHTEDSVVVKLLVLDDRSLPGNTLASRRMQIELSGGKLAKLDQAIFFLGDLIKVAKAGTMFIDSSGKLFKYKKTIRAKLKFYRIQNVIPIVTGGGIVQLYDLPNRFKVLNMPERTKKYAGILHYGLATILYGLYEQEYEETWRLI